jgi:site-specific DNA recombinase
VKTTTTAVLYGRVSNEEGDRFGLKSQITELRELAQRKAYKIAAERYDDGVSGATLERPALSQLRDEVRAGAYQVVMVHAPDRLSRNLAHQLLLLDEFKKAGVRVEFLTTPAEDTAEGRLLLNVSAVIGEFEREKIRDRMMRGKREKARRGLVVSTHPYGYRFAPPIHDGTRLRNSGRLVVFEPEASVIRLVFKLYVTERRSLSQIVRELRSLGIPAPRGAWGRTSVGKILSLDRYTGTLTFNRTAVTVSGRRKVRDERDWIPISVPAIIEPSLYAAAQMQRTKNRLQLIGRPAYRFYLLRGLLRCSMCGASFGSIPNHGHGGYVCRRARGLVTGERCRMGWIGAKTSETAVWDAVASALRNPAMLRRAVAEWTAERADRDAQIQAEVGALAKRLGAVDLKIRKLLDLLTDGEGLPTDDIKARLAALTRERAGLRVQVAEAEGRAVARQTSGIRLEAAERWAAKMRKGIDKLDDRGRRQVLQTIIDRIEVQPDRSLRIRGLVPVGDPEKILSPMSTKSDRAPSYGQIASQGGCPI